MTRAQLEHLIRASATIADDDEIMIVGSQAILGEHEAVREQARQRILRVFRPS